MFAIKYRNIDDLARSDKGRRFRQHVGSDPMLFGLNAAPVESKVLIVVEGELNAASIFQALSASAFTVVSIGLERNSKALEVLDLLIACRGYSETLIWTDEPETALRAGERLNQHHILLMRSPIGLDANDILCAYGSNGLRDLIFKHLGRESR